MGKREGGTPRHGGPGRRHKRDESLDQLVVWQEFFDLLRNARDANGKVLSEHFVRAPSRRTDAEYYDIIQNPIDFSRINQRLRAEEYNTFKDLCADIELVISNAQLYYAAVSPEHVAATELKKVYEEAKNRLLNPPSSASASTEPTPSPAPSLADRGLPGTTTAPDLIVFDAIIGSILNFTDKQGRLVAPPFRVLASKEELPEYYEVISHPIDLKIIAAKARAGEYPTWEAVDDDIKLLVSNCKVFNSPSSQIYKDAARILSEYERLRVEFHGKLPDKSKQQECKPLVAALLMQTQAKDDLDLDQDVEEDESSEQDASPLWQLYWTVRNHDEGQGPLSEPFLELPNRTYYPDYYDEIKRPMSLFVINKRLKDGVYPSLQSLVDDLLLICFNARCYNIESSEFHQSAVSLEKVIASKAKELDSRVVINIVDVPVDDDEPTPKPTPQRQTKKRQRVSFGESDEGTPVADSAYRSAAPKRRKSEYVEFGSGFVPVRKHPQGRKSIEEHRIIYKNKLLKVWNVVRAVNQNQRLIADSFMVLPNAEISIPPTIPVVDLSTIHTKLENFEYVNSQEYVNDYFLMFNAVRSCVPPSHPMAQAAGVLEAAMIKTIADVSKNTLLNLPVRKDRYRHPNGGSNSSSPSKASGSSPAVDRTRSSSAKKQHAPPVDIKVLREVLDYVIKYEDSVGRILSEAFYKLPTRENLPDYYDKIKRPMDLHKIKLNLGHYDSVKSLLIDLKLVFDNACAYNDPSSLIYKDAFVLQKEVLQLRNKYVQDEFAVQAEVKLLLTNLLVQVTTYYHEGRCLSSSGMDDLPKVFKKSGLPEEEYPFSLDEIKFNLDKGRYRRLDRFQEDLFNLFSKIREYNPAESEIFQDTVELQKHYIKTREEVCKNMLISPAKLYNVSDLEDEIEQLLRVRKTTGLTDTKTSGGSTAPASGRESHAESVNTSAEEAVSSMEAEYNNVKYSPKDFVYVSSADESAPPDTPKHIMRIERISQDDEGVLVVKGAWVYRPRETYHLATRLFYTNEVFLTPFKDTVTVDRLRGKCCVMPVDDYAAKKPLDFDDADVYVCESRYLGRRHHFKRLTSWPFPEEREKLATVPRTEPPPMNKVKSELATDGSENGDSVDRPPSKKSATPAATGSRTSTPAQAPVKQAPSSPSDVISDRVKNLPRVLDIHREDVLDGKNAADGDCTYYEQLQYQGTWYRKGDGVLAFNEQASHCDVYRIDRMWKTKTGDTFISGPFFARPVEVNHDDMERFYKKEVIGVEQPDTVVNMKRVQARCAILVTRTYETCRPTEFPECDVFVVERRVAGAMPMADGLKCTLTNNSNNQTTSSEDPPLDLAYSKPLKKLRDYKQSLNVPEDEIFYFKTPLKMEKELSPLLATTEAVIDPADIENDSNSVADTIDDASAMHHHSPSIAGPGSHPMTPATPKAGGSVGGLATPVTGGRTPASKGSAKWLDSQPKLNAKSKSGYILFSAEVRKRVMSENPDAGFGDVSRIVGIEWKKLSDEQKRQYEVRAQYIAEERAKNDQLTASSKMLQPGQIRVYNCKWQTCDYQFDSQEGLYEHIKTSHTSQIVEGDNQFLCLWSLCLKYRKDGRPFPSLPRLHRHIKEKHLPSSSKIIAPNQRGKHFFVYMPPDESAQSSSSKESPPGHFLNCPYGNQAPNVPSCTVATPIEQMSHQGGMATTRAQYVVAGDANTPRTVKVVSYQGTPHHQGPPQGTQYVQQSIPSGTPMPVQYVTVGGQPVYQAVVLNQPGATGAPTGPLQVYHQGPNGQLIQASGNQHYYQPMQQATVLAVQQQPSQQAIAQVSQSYAQHPGPAGGPMHHVQHAVHHGVGHPYQQQVVVQAQTSHMNQQHPGQQSGPVTVLAGGIHQQQNQHQHQQVVTQPAPIVDPRTVVTRAPEPNFVAVPESLTVRRVLHSKTYVKYLDSLKNSRKRQISDWRKELVEGEPVPREKVNLTRTLTGKKNTDVSDAEVARGFYRLRDQLMESVCGLKRYEFKL